MQRVTVVGLCSREQPTIVLDRRVFGCFFTLKIPGSFLFRDWSQQIDSAGKHGIIMMKDRATSLGVLQYSFCDSPCHLRSHLGVKPVIDRDIKAIDSCPSRDWPNKLANQLKTVAKCVLVLPALFKCSCQYFSVVVVFHENTPFGPRGQVLDLP